MTRMAALVVLVLVTVWLAVAAVAQEQKNPEPKDRQDSGQEPQVQQEGQAHLALRVVGARLRRPVPGGGAAQLTARVTVQNLGPGNLGLSQGSMQFFLFDSKDQRVEVQREHAGLLDASLLPPNQAGDREVKLIVPKGVTVAPNTPYHLVVYAYGTAALSSVKFAP